MTPYKQQLDSLLRRTGRTLQLSAAVLPDSVRWVFTVAYLFCRCADTVADTDLIEPHKRIDWIRRFPTMFENWDLVVYGELLEEINVNSLRADERELLQNIPLCISTFNSFSYVDKTLVVDIVKKVCEGMIFDLERFPGGAPRALDTAQELEYYCGVMGGAPGVFWSELILKTSFIKIPRWEFIVLGRGIGNALQIVNILRDVQEDFNIGRVYFPQEDLTAFGVRLEDINSKSPAVKKLFDKWISWGIGNIEGAGAYYRAISKTAWRFRLSVAWPVLWTLDNFILLCESRSGGEKAKLTKKDIYLTILQSPLYLLSNRAFELAIKRKIDKIQQCFER